MMKHYTIYATQHGIEVRWQLDFDMANDSMAISYVDRVMRNSKEFAWCILLNNLGYTVAEFDVETAVKVNVTRRDVR